MAIADISIIVTTHEAKNFAGQAAAHIAAVIPWWMPVRRVLFRRLAERLLRLEAKS